ncbi:11817_t:CDS:2, partial [Racocetra persica]
MVIIQALLDVVVKIDVMMKGLLATLMEADSYEESSVSQSKDNNATQIKCKEIGYLSALNDKISLTIEPKIIPCDDCWMMLSTWNQGFDLDAKKYDNVKQSWKDS